MAPEILDALRGRIDRRIFGYTGLYDDEYYNAFSQWCKDHYDWGFPQEQLCVTPGISRNGYAASAAAKAAAQGTPYSKSEVYKQLLALQAD